MKDFIVLTAILPLLMLFVAQFALDVRNNEEVQIIDNLVYAAKETARQEGGFSPQLKQSLARDIEERLKLEEGSVTVEAERSAGSVGRYDADSVIPYKICVVLPEVMAGGRLMGISEAENRRVYVIDSFTKSEYVGGY